MSRKRLVGLALLLATPLLATGALTAQAGPTPHWYSDGKLISATEPVKTNGKLTFDLTQFGAKLECVLTDSETITNPPTGAPGTDSMGQFNLTGCNITSGAVGVCSAPIKVLPLGLPWTTYLAVMPPAVGTRDVIELTLEFRCGAHVLGNAKGSLNPKVGASVLLFQGGRALPSGFGAVRVIGADYLTGPAGDLTITAH
jgi:hypothetical protein